MASYVLALWCLQAKKSGNSFGFPFDRPLLALAERILTLVDWLLRLLETLPGEIAAGNRLFLLLAGADETLERTVERRRPEVCYGTVETKKREDLDSNNDLGIIFRNSSICCMKSLKEIEELRLDDSGRWDEIWIAARLRASGRGRDTPHSDGP